MVTAKGTVLFGLIVFMCVGIFGHYAGYQTTGYSFDSGDLPSDPNVEAQQIPWWNLVDQMAQIINQMTDTVNDVIKTVPGLGFLTAIANFLFQVMTFQVPDMPLVITLVLWLIGVMMLIAASQIVSGLVTGGGE